MINPQATWIDVNEYMPPEFLKVIVRAIFKDEICYYFAYFSYMERNWCFIDSKHNFGIETIKVTHWMKEPEFYPSPSEDYIKKEYAIT
jgi:hypothetical protein